MRIFILISLLCSIAFSAPVLNGAEYTQVVTINHSQVAETNSDFLYQLKIPRVGNLITAVESADDVAFTNVNDTTRHARWVVYTPDTIYLYAHIAVSSTVDTSYRLQFGKSLNETNAAATFTNCGIVGMWGFDSSLIDYSNGYTLIPLNFGGVYPSGIFGKSATASSNTYFEYPGSILSGRSTFSLSLVIKPSETFNTSQIIISDRNILTIYFQIQCVANKLQVFIGSGSNLAEVPNANTLLPGGTYSMLTVVYNGAGSANADRLKIYVNNVLTSPTFTGTVPSVMPTYTGFFRYGWPPSNLSMRGDYDNSLLRSADRTLQEITTSYNMLFTPSTFSTLGTPIAIDVSAEMGIDTLTFTCSAEGAITYQWYLDGNPLPGETDSVLVIYADSTFYSTAHTLYCLVNSSVISDSWVITTEFSAEMGIDTLRLVCSAENALTYQWYDNNVAVSGATDSVYTIYADSTFYSIKHVIYCLVNGTVKSPEWKFQATISRTSRWDSYKMFYKQAYKNTWK